MMEAAKPHLDRMCRAIRHLLAAKERGLHLKPTKVWKGGCKQKDFEFVASARSDSNFNTQEDGKSVTGFIVHLNGATVAKRCRKQKTVSLSVAEAEENAAVECVQEMLFVMNLLESIGLKVQKPMLLEVDNKGAVDLANSWSVGGRTRHVKHAFMREQKEKGNLRIKWLGGDVNTADVFAKNLPRSLFERHIRSFCGEDDYCGDGGFVRGESVEGCGLSASARRTSFVNEEERVVSERDRNRTKILTDGTDHVGGGSGIG